MSRSNSPDYPAIDGETARKYALCLVRCRTPSGSEIEEANALVDYNIEFHRKYENEPGGISNDIVPFLVLRAGLQRICGDLDAASKTLEGVKRHDFVRRGECTFVATAELELEEIRLGIALSSDRGVLYNRALAVRELLQSSHHWLLAHEAGLLAAECCEGIRRAELLE